VLNKWDAYNIANQADEILKLGYNAAEALLARLKKTN
jgi:hypothetical protein